MPPVKHLYLGSLCLFGMSLSVLSEESRPQQTYIVEQKHPDASDQNSGTSEKPLLTIGKAVEMAMPGDTIYVKEGVYRECLAPERGGKAGAPINYVAEPGGRVIVSGANFWNPEWEPLSGFAGVFQAGWRESDFEGWNPFHEGISIDDRDRSIVARPVSNWNALTKEWVERTGGKRLPRTLGQVFIDGIPLTERETLEEVKLLPGSWIVLADGGGLMVHFPGSPAKAEGRVVEISVRAGNFVPKRRGLSHIQIRGFVFEAAANQGPFPQRGAVSVRSGSDWVIENNWVRYAKTVGIDCGSETWRVKDMREERPEENALIFAARNIIRANRVTDNGLCGIAGWNHSDTIIEGNVVERNNSLQIQTGVDHHAFWWEQAGIKLHASNAKVLNNLVRDNHAFGIWIDAGYSEARITKNVVLENRLAGIFLEYGLGPCLIDNNIIAATDGPGLYAHDASGLTVAHNLIWGNAGYGVWLQKVTDRKLKGQVTGCSDNKILNNLIFLNQRGSLCFPLDGEHIANNTSNGNLFRDGNWLGTTRTAEFRLTATGATAASVEDAIKNMSDAGDGPTDGNLPNRILNLQQWRSVTGRDSSSVALGELTKAALRTAPGNVEFHLPEEALAVRAEAVEGIGPDDYLQGGSDMDALLMPGPFQSLRSGPNYWSFVLPEWDRAGPTKLHP